MVVRVIVVAIIPSRHKVMFMMYKICKKKYFPKSNFNNFSVMESVAKQPI